MQNNWNSAKDTKVLVVGSARHDHVKSIPWNDLASVNILDYDVAVMFLPSLDKERIAAIGTDVLFNYQQVFARFLKSDGHLIVFGAPPLPNDSSGFDRWFWCPVPIVSIPQKGDTVSKTDKAFPNLLGRLKSWDCVYDIHPHKPTQILAMTLLDGLTSLKFECVPYATNRAEGVLAGRYNYFLRAGGGTKKYLPGAVTVLPHFPNDDPHDIVSTALVDILGKPQSAAAPEWVSSILMSPMAPIDARLDELHHEIAVLEKQVELQLIERARLESFKRLLYVSSFELEDLVAECLQMLGATIKPARYSQEEFVMEWKGLVFLAECKGVSKSIALQHVRQVQDYVLKYEEDESTAGKGILFGNAWRDLPPEERDTDDKPIFPGNVAARAEQLSISLVSSVDLFHIFCRFLNKEVTGEAILERITQASGIVDFDRL